MSELAKPPIVRRNAAAAAQDVSPTGAHETTGRRVDPVAVQRKAAAAQIQRSLAAWAPSGHGVVEREGDDGAPRPATKATRKIHRTLLWDSALAPVDPAKNPILARQVPEMAMMAMQADQLTSQSGPPSNLVDVKAGVPGAGVAKWIPNQRRVAVAPLPPTVPQAAPTDTRLHPEVLDRALQLAHELRHVVDAYQQGDPALAAGAFGGGALDEQIHTEINAHASQVKAVRDAKASGEQPGGMHKDLFNGWTQRGFTQPPGANGLPSGAIGMYDRMRGYYRQYGGLNEANALAAVQSLITNHPDWIQAAFAICPETQVSERIP